MRAPAARFLKCNHLGEKLAGSETLYRESFFSPDKPEVPAVRIHRQTGCVQNHSCEAGSLAQLRSGARPATRGQDTVTAPWMSKARNDRDQGKTRKKQSKTTGEIPENLELD